MYHSHTFQSVSGQCPVVVAERGEGTCAGLTLRDADRDGGFRMMPQQVSLASREPKEKAQ